MNKENYNQKIKEFRNLIDIEKGVITQAERNIRNLEFELQRHINSCNHKHDDGTSALKDSYHWHSVPVYIKDEDTGEMMQGDDGYNVYTKECTICWKEID